MDARSARVSPLVESRRKTLEALAAGVKLLPSAFAVPLRVLELKRRPNTSIADIAQAISVEPTLSARVLSLANSAAYAPPVPITRVTIASAMIGLNNLLPLVFGVSFGGIFNKLGLPPAEQAMLWRASVLRAVTAREVARLLNGESMPAADREARAEEAFLAGLFLDVAIPVFYAADRSVWSEYASALDSSDIDRPGHEQRLFATDHMAAAERCAAALKIPKLYAAAAASHHKGIDAIRSATGGPASLAIGINAAAALPHRFKNVASKDLNALAARIRLTSSMTPEALCDLVKEISDGYAETMNLFADPEDAGATFKQFLQELGAEVAESTTHAIAASATEVQNLREQEQQLRGSVTSLEEQAVRAEFDSLTAVLTRAAFLKRFARLLQLARQHGAGCVAGFVDMDNFKQVNDVRGHAAGDAALVALAGLLAGAVRGRGIAGRMGGDEFVFAFVANPAALDADAAAFTAAVRQVEVAHAGQAFATTTSIGVITLRSAAGPGLTPEGLLAEADAMMYEAKRAGKGRAAIGTARSARQRPRQTSGRPHDQGSKGVKMQLTAEYFEQIIASLRHDRGRSRSAERRGMARVGLRAQVTIVPCSAAPEATLAWIRDLSANGIGFMSAKQLSLNTFALVSLPRRDGTRLNLVYTVVRCVPAGTGQFLVGAHLDRVVGREAA